MYLFLDDSKKSKQVRLVDTVSRIFGESSKDKVSIIAANFFGIPEALASWVRQDSFDCPICGCQVVAQERKRIFEPKYICGLDDGVESNGESE